MSDEPKKSKCKLSPALLEKARMCWRKQQIAQRELAKKGIVLCPICRSVMVKKGTLCALCMFKKESRKGSKRYG